MSDWSSFPSHPHRDMLNCFWRIKGETMERTLRMKSFRIRLQICYSVVLWSWASQSLWVGVWSGEDSSASIGCYKGLFLVAQTVKNLPAMGVGFLGQEDPLEKGMATHPSIIAWRIPRTEEPGNHWASNVFTFFSGCCERQMEVKQWEYNAMSV